MDAQKKLSFVVVVVNVAQTLACSSCEKFFIVVLGLCPLLSLKYFLKILIARFLISDELMNSSEDLLLLLLWVS